MKKIIFFLLGLLLSFVFVPLCNAAYYSHEYIDDLNYCEVSSSNTYSSGSCYGRADACAIVAGPSTDNITVTCYESGPTCDSTDRGTVTYSHTVYDTTCQSEPAEPETCFNGIQDGDEAGIDCGGPCSATCENICPPNTENLIGFDGQPGCFWYGLKDSLGNCPGGTTPADDQGYPDACYKEYSTIPAVAGTEVDAVDDLSFTAGSLSTVEQVYPTTTTDNGDGTSSKTTITERTGSGGETTTTTKTDVIDNTTGAVLSSTTNTEQETPIEENPDNYSYDIGSGDLPDSDFMDLPEEANFDSLFDQINSWNPFANMDDEMKITVANPTCSFGCDVDLSSVYLGSHTLEFGLCEYEWAFNAIGVVLNFGAVFLSFCIVVRG